MDRLPRAWMVAIAVTAFFVAPLFAQAAPPRNLSGLEQRRQEYHTKFVRSLTAVARFCEANGFPEDAARIRELAAPVDMNVVRFRPLPRKIQPELPADLPALENQWRTELRHHRLEHAKKLYLLSRQFLRARYVNLAYDVVREALLHDPDHPPARKFLGFVRSGDEWSTLFEAKMRRKYVDTEKFGWLPKQQVARYEKGERYFKNRWMSAEKEAELRRDFRNAWEIRTEHYLLKTNYSLERGAELARQLEDFYSVFFQTFAAFFNNHEQLQQQRPRRRKTSRASTAKVFEVHYYRDREEYLERLRPQVELIDITTGLYLSGPRIAYFYHDPQMDDDPDGPATRTIFHEATHQLFSENRPSNVLVGTRGNFWIIEGIACYMETYQKTDTGFSLGDPKYQRFVAGRFRYLDSKYFIPLRKFSAIGMTAFRNDPRIATNYSQAAELTRFFMDYDNGRYRRALIKHLSQIYSVDKYIRLSPATLEYLTAVEFEELDRQYGEFVKQTQRELSGKPD